VKGIVASALSALLFAGSVRAQSPSVNVTWLPETPVVGTLFRIRVSAPLPGLVNGATGTLAGEPLHFFAVSDTLFEALAAVPIDAADSITMPLGVIGPGGVETIPVTIRLAGGEYRLEKLTVAPQFGTPYDSATQSRIRREQAKAAQVSRNAHATQRLWTGEIVHPRNTRITSRFGDGREFNGQIQSRHMGTDFSGTTGSPVRAAARGVVALVDSFFLAGNVIYIDHGAGLVTAYFHLSRQDVAQGDTVEANQVIGLVGATGRVTGPHLHWVVRYGGITVNPLSFLALADSTAGASR
jgi:murein DD-endopeptidase MepM/ murein hydrolase activator NlpD